MESKRTCKKCGRTYRYSPVKDPNMCSVCVKQVEKELQKNEARARCLEEIKKGNKYVL